MIVKLTILIMLIMAFLIAGITFLVSIKTWRKDWIWNTLGLIAAYLFFHCVVEFLRIIQWTN